MSETATIAYFSIKIALEPGIPTYSGDLGMLAGDTLRAAADRNLPMVGVSLLYRCGYFVQTLDGAGRQSEACTLWQPERFLRKLAARVPVATLLMVTEMTGGYHLLVPAALAVVMSFMIQGTPARRLKYRSLYEAQVSDRVDSPAHHLDHVEAALKLLREKQLAVPPTVTHVHLRQLLAAGNPVDLPDRKRLLMGVLDAESFYVGKRLSLCFPVANQDDVELIAVLRCGHTLLPHTNVRLQAGDRLLAIVSADGQEQLAPHLSSSARTNVERKRP